MDDRDVEYGGIGRDAWNAITKEIGLHDPHYCSAENAAWNVLVILRHYGLLPPPPVEREG